MKYRQGDLLAVTEGIIVHGCNAHGVMGSGVARQIRRKYPGAYDVYVDVTVNYRSQQRESLLGTISVFNASEDLTIVNAITQLNYGSCDREVSYDAVDTCFAKIEEYFSDRPIHIPKIGAGLANGNWKVLEQIILQYDLDVTCWIHG